MGLSLLLLSYLILAVRSALLVYHGCRHDLVAAGESSSSSSSSATPGQEEPALFDGESGVTVGSGRHWCFKETATTEIYTMMNASFEQGFGVWGGKNSELGE